MRGNIVACSFYCCLSDPKVEAAFVAVRAPVEIRCQEVRSQQKFSLVELAESLIVVGYMRVITASEDN
jgi:hypothetical protein